MLNVFAVNSSSAAFNIFSSPPSIPPPGTTKLHNSRHLPIPLPTPPPLPRKKKKTEEENENGAISEQQQQRRKGKGKQVFKHNGVFTTKLGEERGVTIGEDGTSYRVAGAPFEFRFSYSETPRVRPLALREKPYVPFGPPTVNRPWTGRAPLPKSKKMLPELDSFRPPKPGTKGVKYVQPPGPFFMGKGPLYGASSRDEVLGEPLTREEINELVEKSIRCSRQVNLGRDGLTHNMLELIHTHWKRRRVCRIKCKGVPTVDMDNVYHHLEEKTGGSIIHRVGGVVYLFRGRNYNYKDRPKFPLMLWKPATPVYPKLIVRAPEGLTVEEADALRRKGRHLPAICKLGKNGVYFNLVKNVREAFEENELVRINCQGMKPSDYKRIGAKLKEMVPCVLLSFDKEHILMWRGKEYEVNKSKESATKPSTWATECLSDDSSDSRIGGNQSTDQIICTKLGESAASLNMQSVKQSSFSSSIDSALESKIVASQFKESREEELNILPVSVQSTESICDRRRDCQPHKEYNVTSKYETSIKIKDSSGIVDFSDTEGCLNPVDMSKYAAGNSSTDDINVAVDSSQTSSESLLFPTTGVRVFDAKFVESVKNDSLDLLSKLDCQKHEDIQGGEGVLEDKDTKEKERLTTKEAKGCRKAVEHIESLWHQAIESRIALLLDDPCLDPDLILEKSDNFAQTAPPGQYVRSKQILSARKGGKHEKPAIGDGGSNQSEAKKMSQEISPFLDTVPLGMLPVDDLARLLLAP